MSREKDNFVTGKTPKITKITRIIFILLLLIALPSEAQTLVTLHTTRGDMVLQLYDDTPLHRDNFLQLVESGFLDGKRFNRVIRDFMIQCGEEQTEHNLPAEIRYPKHFHQRGALAMGRSGDDPEHLLESNAEQFYIVWGKQGDKTWLHRADSLQRAWSYGQSKMTRKMRKYYTKNPGTPHLDGSYTVFGQMVQGLDILDSIQSTPTDRTDQPLIPVTINKAEVTQLGTLIRDKVSINITEMYPRRGPSRILNYGYNLTVSSDSVTLYLPYFGQVYEPDMNYEGLNFTLPITKYERQQDRHGRQQILFRCRKGIVEYRFRLILDSNGKAVLELYPSNADSIGYEGYID